MEKEENRGEYEIKVAELLRYVLKLVMKAN